ncbi:C40 family peptidase [Acuticoccus sp. M5D2P5]|uniref:C40 family peptidase n=1 Tax=Acuticoccus kalidii TaxID=2910977 RepID=UPI001F3BC779|nr:NlpC/P60 family protein [Acuticoccus kalidii]MCF3932376.1 C40 family peptidase [Acuticoccus kalidii]
MKLDTRRNAVRDDLADVRLEDAVKAPRYATPTVARIAVPITACRRRPRGDAPLDTEFLFGEPVDVFDRADGWAWVQSGVDGYVGYVREEALAGPGAPTHRVSAPLALVFPSPSIKVPPSMRLPMGAWIETSGEDRTGGEHFHALADGGYILDQHVSRGPLAADWVSIAEIFVGAPYYFGGKSWDGIDCSGLVQIALQAAGQTAPRDSDMQEAELGAPLPLDPAGLVRGDLVFWKGHVGIMLDEERLLHANGFHMMTAVERLADTIARLRSKGLPPTMMRRVVA